MHIFFGAAFLFAAALATFYALQCLYVIFGYRQGNVGTVTATLTNHSVRRCWYGNQRWYDMRWTGYIYSYRVGGVEYTIKGSIRANGDRLPGKVRLAYQRSNPDCSFIPVLSGPAQLQSVLVSMVAAAVSFAFGIQLLLG